MIIIHRGHCMAVQRYEYYFQVVHKLFVLVCKILFLQFENKIHILSHHASFFLSYKQIDCLKKQLWKSKKWCHQYSHWWGYLKYALGFGYTCSFVWIFQVVYFPVKHCTYIICFQDSPVSLDVSAGSNVVLGCQDKLIVQHPLRLVIQASRWMQLYNLKSE